MNDKRQTKEQKLARYCKALGHPARIRIVRLLAAQGTCQTGSLVDQLPLAQSTISEHLRILREAGLVTGDIDGPRRCYCIDDGVLAEMQAMLANL